METDAAVQGILDRLVELVEYAESLTPSAPPREVMSLLESCQICGQIHGGKCPYA